MDNDDPFLDDALARLDEQAAKPYHRYTKDERMGLMDKMIELKYREKASWDEVADKFGLARSTIARWRKGDEWRMTEARWRRVMREEARSDTTMLAKDALGVLQDIMNDAKITAFTRYSAAAKILDLVGIDQEFEEARSDQNDALTKFTLKMAEKGAEVERLKAQGIAPVGEIIDAEVNDKGGMPESIAAANSAMRERMREELEESRRRALEQLEGEEAPGVGDELFEGDDD